MLTKSDLSEIQKLVKVEVQGSEQRLGKRVEGLADGMVDVEKKLGKRIDSLSSKIDRIEESVDIIQEVVVKHYNQPEQRVVKLEEKPQSSDN